MDRIRKLFSSMGPGSPFGAAVQASIGVGAIGYLGYNSLFTVEGGHRAVVYNRVVGVKEDVYPEGMHFMIPWFERPVIFDVRTRPRNLQSLTGSKDLQMVNITLRVLSKPDAVKLPWIYCRLGLDFDERVLPSIVNEVTKAVVARYNASELLTRREIVSKQIRDALVARATEFMIVLDDVSITHLSFSREYTNAVEAKQVAQQDAERSRYIVDKALQEKKSIVIKANGEAQSARLVGEAIRDNPGFVQLRKIDAAKEIAETVTNSNNRVFLSADALLLNQVGDTTNWGTSGKGKK